MKRFLLRVAVFGVFFGLVTEAFFRWGLPAREIPTAWQGGELRVKRYDPEGPRDGVFTSGRYAQQRSPWHINAQGWNSAVDYVADSDRDKPVVAVLGDSQIEGFYVSYEEHLGRTVEAGTDQRYQAYAYGGSGYKLGQYILIARHLAAQGIAPRYFILHINRGDLWSAVTNLGGSAKVPYLTLTARDDGGFDEHPPRKYGSPWYRRMFRFSALARYVVFNARVNPFSGGVEKDQEFAEADQQPEGDAETNPIYARTAEYAVAQIRAALPNTRVVFMHEGDRKAVYRGDLAHLPVSRMLEAVCARVGCGFFDLTDTFAREFAANGRRFEFAHNPHWTAYGHQVVGRAIADYINARDAVR